MPAQSGPAALVGLVRSGAAARHDTVWAVSTQSDQTPAATSRTVLVTGANRGIGRAIAQAFQAAGHRVAGTSRSGEGMPAGVLGVSCDITDPDQVEAMFTLIEAEYGPVEVLVANAGVNHDTLVMRMSDEDFQQVVDTNLTGTFRTVRRAVRPMVRNRFGRIVLLSSVVALLGSAGQVNYAASKAALVGLARSLAREIGSRGITVNVVAPGFIETAMTAELSEKQVAEYAKMIPAGRMGQVEDVATAVRFLTEDATGYITGAVIPVDGGLGMGH